MAQQFKNYNSFISVYIFFPFSKDLRGFVLSSHGIENVLFTLTYVCLYSCLLLDEA